MRKKAKLRVAFIGCGGIAGRHVQVLLPDKRVEITRLVDPSAKNLKRFKERFPDLASVPTCADYREVLGEVDAVVILSPHTLHYPQVMDALDRGLDVLCEKPLACTAAHAKQLVEKVRQTRRKLQVTYQRRSQTTFQHIRDEIRSGGIGRLRYISVVLCQEWHQSQKGTWRQDPKLSGGGQLNDSGSHVMDMLLWLTPQKPRRVSALLDNRGRKVDIDSTVSVQFDRGALASIAIIATAMTFSERWIFAGSEATLILEGGSLKRIDKPNGPVRELPVSNEEKVSLATNWVDAILDGAKLMSPAKDVIHVVRLTEAIWKSAARGGRPVEL